MVFSYSLFVGAELFPPQNTRPKTHTERDHLPSIPPPPPFLRTIIKNLDKMTRKNRQVPFNTPLYPEQNHIICTQYRLEKKKEKIRNQANDKPLNNNHPSVPPSGFPLLLAKPKPLNKTLNHPSLRKSNHHHHHHYTLSTYKTKPVQKSSPTLLAHLLLLFTKPKIKHPTSKICLPLAPPSPLLSVHALYM